ncbi:MobF family relaxase [Streptomyces sp. NPDC050988]|uniref:MobF family relaxase n=1 Tax=Streptomyces sp. NPDC050988 TaxID=3365637 RepID=UPI00378E0DDA
MLYIKRAGPDSWRLYFDRAEREEGLVPPGLWTGRGLAAMGLHPGSAVTERQAELLLGKGMHPNADEIKAALTEAGQDTETVRQATVLGRPVAHIARPLLAVALEFRASPSVHLLWALGDEQTRAIVEDAQTFARDRTIAWIEDAVAQVRWGDGGRHRSAADGLVVAVFRRFDNLRGAPLLTDHALVSVKVQRPDGKWGNFHTAELFRYAVAAGTLFSLLLMEEITERLKVTWEPREVTAGSRPVWEIAGIPHELIAWKSSRRQEIAHYTQGLFAWYEARHGHPPGEHARHALARWAAEDTGPDEHTPLPLPVLRHHWRQSAAGLLGSESLLRTAQDAAEMTCTPVRPRVDVGLAAVEITAIVGMMRGGFCHQHLLAEARRYLAATLRGHRHTPGTDEDIVAEALSRYCIPAGTTAGTWTADWSTLYPDQSDDGTKAPESWPTPSSRYQRAQITARIRTDRLRAIRRDRRLLLSPGTATPDG